jgi:hypothetical protein
LLGFFILIAQHFFHFSKVRKLQGAFIPKEQPILTSSNWFSGNYQDSLSIYLNENIGFRNYFVRLNNQIAFSLFDFARANGVVVGKENFLYERNYIRAYLGKDYIGEAAIAEKVRKLEKIQDRLKKRDIELIVVFAPGKGSFYPEYIPTDQVPSENNNYKTYVRLLNNTPINLIDFNKWFRKKKGTTVAPLYPKTGIHWSRFGELMAADSLLKYIDKLKGTLVDFNTLENILDDTEGVGAWQIEIRKCNDDPMDKDEIIMHVVPMDDAGDSLEDKIRTTLVQATEISPNRIEFHDWATMRKMHGVGKELKEKKVVDNRPKEATE